MYTYSSTLYIQKIPPFKKKKSLKVCYNKQDLVFEYLGNNLYQKDL